MKEKKTNSQSVHAEWVSGTVLSASHGHSYSVLIRNLHFTDEKTETRRDNIAAPKPPSWGVIKSTNEVNKHCL